MFEGIITGIIQGVAEWLPVSSEGIITLVKINVFNKQGFEMLVKESLFLHFGTLVAALVYLRKDIVSIFKSLVHYNTAGDDKKRIIRFLFISTLVSGFLGLLIIKLFSNIEEVFDLAGKTITIIIGVLLLVTGWLQIRARDGGRKDPADLTIFDGILLGVAQGLAVLPGLSRSGLTVSFLLLRNFDKNWALKLSFLMSLPIVFLGNIVWNFKQFSFTEESMWGMAFSFIFGLLTIGILFKIAGKINFGLFVLFFGIITVLSIFI